MSQFQKFPSIPRYRKDIKVYEKIDGTNAGVAIQPFTNEDGTPNPVAYDAPAEDVILSEANEPVHVYAQARNRVITPGKSTDNYGFAQWVRENQYSLYLSLGTGYHFGEWYGSGINRNYGLDHKRFMLFNPDRYASVKEDGFAPKNVDVAPLLYSGPPTYRYGGQQHDAVEEALDGLKHHGSYLVPGFMNPEGVVIFHTASRQLYKATFDYDEGKWTA